MDKVDTPNGLKNHFFELIRSEIKKMITNLLDLPKSRIKVGE